MLGAWDVNINQNMPQKVATAVAGLNERFGCEYEPVAYLGSQVVNGTLHAVIVKQKVVLGEDQVNVNIVKFLETKDGVAEISNDIAVAGGKALGGIQIDPKFGDEIPEDAKKAFEICFDGFVGSKVEPVALIYSQVTKGVDYAFLAEVTGVTANPQKSAMLVTVNSMTRKVGWVDLLSTKEDIAKNGVLGYAFTWLTAASGE